MDNKEILSANLQKYMEINGKTREDISKALGYSYFTVTSWVNGTKYPRMDKIIALANYFGVKISDLIEKEVSIEDKKNNDIWSDIIIRLRTDKEFAELIETLYKLDSAKLKSVIEMLKAFT